MKVEEKAHKSEKNVLDQIQKQGLSEIKDAQVSAEAQNPEVKIVDDEEITKVLNRYGIRRTVLCRETFTYGGSVGLSDKFFFKGGQTYRIDELSKSCYHEGYDYGLTTDVMSKGQMSKGGVFVPQDNFCDLEDEPMVAALKLMSNPSGLRLLAVFLRAGIVKLHLHCVTVSVDLNELQIGQVVTIGSDERCTYHTYEGLNGLRFNYPREVISPVHFIVIRDQVDVYKIFDASEVGESFLVFD